MRVRVAVAGPQAGAFCASLSGQVPPGIELVDASRARRADWVLVPAERERAHFAVRFALPPARVVRSEAITDARSPDAQARAKALLEKMAQFGPATEAGRGLLHRAARPVLACLARRLRPPVTAREEKRARKRADRDRRAEAARKRAERDAQKQERVTARFRERESARQRRADQQQGAADRAVAPDSK